MTSTPLRAPHRLFAARGPHRPAGVWPVDAGIEDVLLEPLVFPGIFTTTVTSTRRRHKTIRAGIKLPTPGINRASLSQACHLRIGPGHLHLRLAPAPGQGPPGPAGPRRRSRELLAIPRNRRRTRHSRPSTSAPLRRTASRRAACCSGSRRRAIRNWSRTGCPSTSSTPSGRTGPAAGQHSSGTPSERATPGSPWATRKARKFQATRERGSDCLSDPFVFADGHVDEHRDGPPRRYDGAGGGSFEGGLDGIPPAVWITATNDLVHG